MRLPNKISSSLLMLALAIPFGLPTSSPAQPRARMFPDSTRINAMVDTLAARLALSDSVKSKVREIYFASFENMRKEMQKNRGDFRAMRKTRKKILDERDEKIKALLTDEQKKKYDKLLEAERQRMRERMSRRRRGRRF